MHQSSVVLMGPLANGTPTKCCTQRIPPHKRASFLEDPGDDCITLGVVNAYQAVPETTKPTQGG